MENETPETNANETPEENDNSAGNVSSSAPAEMDALRTENEELKQAIRLNAARAEITAELEKLGAVSPKLLFDMIGPDLRFDAAGKTENAADLLRQIRSDHPEQFAAANPVSVNAGTRGGANTMLTAEALRQMTPAEIAKLDWEDVRRVLTNGN